LAGAIKNISTGVEKNYMMSIAFTKEVVKNGSIKVSQGQCE
jgi:hypothetical protein